MKKIIAIFLLVALSASLFSCAKNETEFTKSCASTNNSVQGTTGIPNIIEAGIMKFEKESLPYGKGYIKSNNTVNDMDEYVYEPYTQIVLSTADLGGKLEEYCRSYSASNEEFFKMFDEAFFEKYALVCIGTKMTSSTYLPESVCVKAIEKGEKIEVEFYISDSDISTQDVTSATIILIVDKDAVDGSEKIIQSKAIAAKS